MAGNRDGDGAFRVVPVESDAEKFRARFIGGYDILVTEGGVKVFEVLVAEIFEPKIVDDQ